MLRYGNSLTSSRRAQDVSEHDIGASSLGILFRKLVDLITEVFAHHIHRQLRTKFSLSASPVRASSQGVENMHHYVYIVAMLLQLSSF